MAPAAKDLCARVDNLDWPQIDGDLDAWGVARLGRLLTPTQCDALTGLYDQERPFRSRIVMARHGFGEGEYKYFAYPLPELVQHLREAIYPHAARTANRWAGWLGKGQNGGETAFPDTLDGMLARCHAAGQSRPTPLILRYRSGDYNCLHQDLYGEHVFPLQLVILLSDPAAFEGGAFVMTEQRPRMQSRAEVVPLAQGEAALFCVSERPKPRSGSAGSYYRVKMRHGVSRLISGERFTAGIIFHDAA